MKKDLYDRGLNTLRIWLPIDDRKKEGAWKDFYTGTLMQNYTLPWAGSKPDGGVEQNCAFLLSGDTWEDYECDSPHRACMCTHKPHAFLELKGLCPNSAIDVSYKIISDAKDKRKLRLQGLTHTSIAYNDDKEMWILDTADTNVTGTSKARHASHWENTTGRSRATRVATEVSLMSLN